MGNRLIPKTAKTKNMIVAIASNKGGVGKTSIAICFSFFCAKNIGKTLLLELDSSPGDLGTLFDIDFSKSVDIAIRFPDKYKNYVKEVFKNLDVLIGFPNPIIAENVKEEQTRSLINSIQKDYDCIIIDTQTVINGIIIDFLKITDHVFVISEYGLESISRVSSLISILTHKFYIPLEKIKFLINKKRLLDFLKIWDISKILNYPIEGFIPFDRKFNKSVFLFDRKKVLKTKFFLRSTSILKNILINNEFK